MAVTGIVMVAYLVTHVLGQPAGLPGAGEDQRATAGSSTGPAARSGPRGWCCSRAVVLHIVAARAAHGAAAGGAARSATRGSGNRRSRTLAARTIRWGGGLILVFLVFHILHFTTRHGSPLVRRGRSLPQRRRRLRQSVRRPVLRGRRWPRWGCICTTASGAADGAWASARRRRTRFARQLALALVGDRLGGLHGDPDRGVCRGDPAMTTRAQARRPTWS